ncbi:MAG: N-acetylglucosamine-6-phosphate deacetylase [Thermoleophilia bacterium]|nr:N-acetylglucosamine-6-phosphate deacetylase [Thermoleophilia bacterium]
MGDSADITLRGLCLGRRTLTPGAVHIAGGTFADVAAPGADTVDLPDGWVITPGLVDVQVNGYAGLEVDAPGALPAVRRALAEDGVVAFCPTLVSRHLHAYPDAVSRLTDGATEGAAVAGIHLEGPFLSPRRAGAHDPAALCAADPHSVGAVAAFEPAIVTLAPEVPGALDAIGALRAAGTVVAVGHTECDADALDAAATRGARLVTHAFNAMPGITARGASPLAAALQDERLYVSLIADGHHVRPEVCRLSFALAGHRMVLVSDASAAAGAPPGAYALGGRKVTSDGEAVRDADGRLAGGALPLWRCVRRAVDMGVPRAHALWAACGAPREVLGRRVAERRASLAVFDADHRPRAVMVDGAWVGSPGWE